MIDPDRKKIRSGELALSKAQVLALLSAIDDFPHKVFFELEVNLGFRRGDIVCLSWKDVDFRANTLSYFERKKDRVRVVPLAAHLVVLLRQLRKLQPDEYYVFPGFVDKKRGKGHMSERKAYDLFQKYLVAAGIQGVGDRRPFHCLRATCIKLCGQAGFTPEQAAKHIGDSLRVVQEHYGVPSDAEMAEVVNERSLL